MSFSDTSTAPMRRKRTITLSERVTENGDPLVIKKKAREAAEKAVASTTKKTTQVFFISFLFLKKTHLLYHIRKPQSKMLLKIGSSLRNPFLKRRHEFLSSQMEAMMTNRLKLTLTPLMKGNPLKLTPEMINPQRVLKPSLVKVPDSVLKKKTNSNNRESF